MKEKKMEFTVKFPKRLQQAKEGLRLTHFGKQLRKRLDKEYPYECDGTIRKCSLRKVTPEQVVWKVDYIKENKASVSRP